MKRIVSPMLLGSVFFATMFVACRKNHSTDGSAGLTVEDAKSYVQRLESKYGNYDLVTVSGKTEKSFKSVDFSQAYTGENETSFFVEAPISYTKRVIVLSAASGMPTATLNQLFKNSFDRIVIYKDKVSGLVNEKIVTVIPSVDYVSTAHKDLYNNHYQSIAKEFSGFVSYKNWKGQFLSSQSYNLGKTSSVTTPAKTARVNDIGNCGMETIYRGYAWCEDYDENGNGVNCDYIIISEDVYMCDLVNPVFHNHSAILPSSTDQYWQGWPDPKGIPDNTCPGPERVVESPIMYAAINATSFSVTFWGACFCQGYSYIILEDVPTGTEYSFPIENQNFFTTNCTTIWETNVQIPASVPNGQYFVKVWLDGDVFYHQLEQDGTIIKRWKQTLSR